MSGKAVLSDEDVIEVEEDEREVPEGYAVDPEDRHDEDDEEDEEGEDEYEKDGFIVDDVDEDDQDGDEADSDEERQKKKKRKKRESEKNYVLDEDDYELLQDNNVGFQRPKSKYKRLKKARAEDADIGEDDEMADFIVDEEEVDEHGEPTRKRKVINKKNRVSSSAMQEAYEIFGDVDELIKKRKLGLEIIMRYADAGECKEKKLEDESERMQFKRPKRKSQSSICSKSGLWEVASKFGCSSEEFGQLFSLEQMVSKFPILTSRLHKFKPRMIVHPRFLNITADEAKEMLSDKEAGESIVRPSSRGYSHLTLTLKIYDGVYAHKDMTSLGKSLKIGEDIFEDLDEVMDRYVDPLVTHLKTMLAHRKFREGGKTEVDEILRKEKIENPSRIVYAFGISHEHPGTFILTYIRSLNPHHEYVGLYPKGFKFREKMFKEINRLVAYFQRQIDDPHDAGPSIRSVAAMVPMRRVAALV